MCRAWILAGSAAFLALPGSAAAGTVSVNAGTLTYIAAPGERNSVDVLRYSSSYGNGYAVYEEGARLIAGAGCQLRGVRGRAVCLDPVQAFRAELGDRDDLLTVRALAVPATIDSGPGADLIEGGSAGDLIDAGPGTDTVVGNAGDDAATGGTGGDLLQGGTGADSLTGQAGDDVAMGQGGSGDQVSGGAGRDMLLGGGGSDTLRGDAGGDALVGGGGIDKLDGGAGDDKLTDADAAAGTVNCGAGEDAVRVSGDVALRNCAGSATAPLTAPTSWPPRTAAAMIAQVPSAKPRVAYVRPRTQGNARYLSVHLVYGYFKQFPIRVRFYNAANRRIGGEVRYLVWARNPQNVSSPRPPRTAVRATATCC